MKTYIEILKEIIDHNEIIKKLQILYNHPNTEPNVANVARTKEKELKDKYNIPTRYPYRPSIISKKQYNHPDFPHDLYKNMNDILDKDKNRDSSNPKFKKADNEFWDEMKKRKLEDLED